MKRIGVILFTLLFVGVLAFIPCFADGAYNLSATLPSSIVATLTYSTVDGVSGIQYVSPTLVFNRSNLDPYTNVVNFYNPNDYSVKVILDTSVTTYTYSLNEFVIYPHSSVDVTCKFSSDNSLHSGICRISSINQVDESYTVFNAGGVIGSISNVFGMIFNSSTILLPLFLIGVTVSLGLVAIRFIRKVMWSR